MVAVTLDIFGQELAAHRAGRQHVVVAVITAPFGKVVDDVEGSRGGGGIFVVDEVDNSRFVFRRGAFGQHDDVGAEKVTVRENQLM